MTARTVPELLDRLADSGLVPADALDRLRGWAASDKPGLGQFAQEVLNRSLLTPYQLKEVAGGRADRLTLGPYRLLEPVGEGGMGQVFRAVHTRLGREAAVKVIRREKVGRANVVERFREEIRAAGRLHHPNVVLAFDADEADGRHYYAMEYVPGVDLAKLVADRGPLPPAEAVGYVRQAADGLQHAADLGLVHRDVKPANLLLTPDGRVKVLDLGLALLTADPGEAVDRPGLVVGSPDFLAPEQARDPLAVDCRADVYGLGGTLYYLLTGKPPVAGESHTDKVLQHLTAPVPSVRDHRPDLPPGLDAVVKWMLAKSPADRPSSPAAAAAALAPFEAGGSGVRPLPAAPPPSLDFELEVVPPQVPPAGSKRPSWPVALALAAAVGAVGTGLTVFKLSRLSGKVIDMPARFVNPVGMTLVRVDGDACGVGSPASEPGRRSDESQRVVNVEGPFFVGTTEVTNGQFLAVLGRSPSRLAARLRDAKAAPVEGVTYFDAVEFCKKLSERDAGRIAGWVYRLPTEHEWEYFARAGARSAFWCGDRVRHGDTAVFDPAAESHGLADPPADRESGFPRPVGSTRPNPFGLHEVCGNLWEWTSTKHEDGVHRVARGGGWRSPAADCRSAARRAADERASADDVGLRVVFGPDNGR